jgi:predicted regulator of Ras-like GTPase activity (Roadblock/LC7/MglB family)
VRREEHGIAALAIAQLGLAIAVLGIAIAGGYRGVPAAANWSWLSLPVVCAVAGVLLVGVAVGALVFGRVLAGRAPVEGGVSEADALRAAGVYRLTEEAEVDRLAAMPGGDPFRELLRPMVQVDAVRAAAFSTREGLTLSARLPRELDADRLSALVPELLAAAPGWLPDDGRGVEEEVCIRKGGHSLLILARGQILLSAVLDKTASEDGAARDWLEATAAAGAKLWTARYGVSDQESAMHS